VLLDEIVELITEQAKSSSEIKFYAGGQRVYRAKADDDMITISGMEG
ncbi:TPA: DNA phosphorothioation-dependent restriction protein DptF, partial [Escherichia coli]|nr:DNA phosphorothioation-dependent restriction protein DptF [Escherichia coli]